MEDTFKAEDTYIRSTDTSRTIWTARQIWKGFYPESKRNTGGMQQRRLTKQIRNVKHTRTGRRPREHVPKKLPESNKTEGRNSKA